MRGLYGIFARNEAKMDLIKKVAEKSSDFYLLFIIK